MSSGGCGGCADRERVLATEQRRRTRALYRILAALGLSAAALVGLLTVLATGGNTQLEGLFGGMVLMGPAFALVTWTKQSPRASRVDEEERHPKGAGVFEKAPVPTRRGLLVGGGAALAALVAGGVVTRGSAAEQALRQTSWRSGTRLVTSEGGPISVEDMTIGGLQTVWPEDAVGRADSQAVLIRLEEGRLRVRPGREDWSPEGYVAYSKLCTHMGCPVGLYQQDPDVLLCPCHQASFDILDGGRAVHGPASRALPQLPLFVGDDGYLRAGGDFPEPVGAGFWRRPRS
jgi:ubiquinol-cytochrome c reductase iron-sulfur subunit